MGIPVHLMRKKISEVYPGRWASKVACMPDKQVMAIYFRFVRDGVFVSRGHQSRG